MPPDIQKRPRIAYVSGPIDAASVFERWKSKGREANYFGTVYLDQFITICSQLNADLYVITTLPGGESLKQIDWCTVHNLPTPGSASGLRYHVQSVLWALRVVRALLRFEPDVVVSTAMQNYWFVLCVLKIMNIKLVSSLHSAIWPQFSKTKPSLKFLNKLNSLYYRYCASAFMTVSADIKSQICKYYKISPEMVREFIPTYDRQAFSGQKPKPFAERPFTVLFCGRVEENKGVFHLVEMAKRLRALDRGRFLFHVCGDGSQLAALRDAVRKAGLQDIVLMHGQCNVTQLKTFIEASHIFIVPTTTDCEEGFNKVCAEGVLSARPVVTSPVCPAINYITSASMRAVPDDVDSYVQAILKLSEDEALYREKSEACMPEREKFFDSSKSYGAQLALTLEHALGRNHLARQAGAQQ